MDTILPPDKVQHAQQHLLRKKITEREIKPNSNVNTVHVITNG